MNIERRLWLPLLCIGCVIAGCSVRQIVLSDIYPRIYLYTGMESSQKVKAVSQALKEKSYSVVLTDLPVPKEFMNTTIIYSPIVNPDSVDSIAGALEMMGYRRVEKIYRAAANHSYGRFNAGVYLVP